MTNYYNEKKKVNNIIDNKIRELKEDEPINVKPLCMFLTAEYAISKKAIYERIQNWLELDGTLVLTENGMLKRIGGAD